MQKLENVYNELGKDFPWTLIDAYFSKRTFTTISSTSIRII